MHELTKKTHPPELGAIGYAAYDASGPNPGKTWDGKPMPSWDELKDPQKHPVGMQTRERWGAAAAAIAGNVVLAIKGDARVSDLTAIAEELKARKHPGDQAVAAALERLADAIATIAAPDVPPPPDAGPDTVPAQRASAGAVQVRRP